MHKHEHTHSCNCTFGNCEGERLTQTKLSNLSQNSQGATERKREVVRDWEGSWKRDEKRCAVYWFRQIDSESVSKSSGELGGNHKRWMIKDAF